MNTFNINQHGVTVKNDNGTSMIRTNSPHFAEAKEAVMHADWDYFHRLVEDDERLQNEVAIDIALSDDTPNEKVRGMIGLIGMITGMTMDDIIEDDSPEFEDEDSFVSIEKTLADVQGLLADVLISAEDLITEDNLDQFVEAMPTPTHEHDLSNWSGSPIFYPTREMARAQSDRWGMFWEYHDFGIASPAGYRYATVPRGIGPTAPDGYDWVCLPREE